MSSRARACADTEAVASLVAGRFSRVCGGGGDLVGGAAGGDTGGSGHAPPERHSTLETAKMGAAVVTRSFGDAAACVCTET